MLWESKSERRNWRLPPCSLRPSRRAGPFLSSSERHCGVCLWCSPKKLQKKVQCRLVFSLVMFTDASPPGSDPPCDRDQQSPGPTDCSNGLAPASALSGTDRSALGPLTPYFLA